MLIQLAPQGPGNPNRKQSVGLTAGRPVSGRVVEDLGQGRYRLQVGPQTIDIQSSGRLRTGQTLHFQVESRNGTIELTLREPPLDPTLGRALENSILPRTAGAVLAEMGLEDTPGNRSALAALAEWGLPADPETIRIIEEASIRMKEPAEQGSRYAAFLASRGVTPTAGLLEAISTLLQGSSPPPGTGSQMLPLTYALLGEGDLSSRGLPPFAQPTDSAALPSASGRFYPTPTGPIEPLLQELRDRIAQRAQVIVRSDPTLSTFRSVLDLLQNPLHAQAESSSQLARQLLLLFQNTSTIGSNSSITNHPEWAAQLLKSLSLPTEVSETDLSSRLKSLPSSIRQSLVAQVTQAESEWIQQHTYLSRLSQAFQEIDQATQRLHLMKLWSPPTSPSTAPSPSLAYAGEWISLATPKNPDDPKRLFVFYRPKHSSDSDQGSDEATAYIDLQLSSLDRLKIFVELRGRTASIRIDSLEESIRRYLETAKERLLEALDSLDLTVTVHNRLVSDHKPPPEDYRVLSEELDRFFWQPPDGEFHGIDLRI